MSLFRRLAVIASSPCSSLLTKTLTKTATATTSRGFSSMATISRKMKTSTPTGITAASTTTTGTGTGTVGWLGSLHHATAGIITRSFASKKVSYHFHYCYYYCGFHTTGSLRDATR